MFAPLTLPASRRGALRSALAGPWTRPVGRAALGPAALGPAALGPAVLARFALGLLAFGLLALGLAPHAAPAQTSPAPLASGEWPMAAQNLQGTGQSPFGTHQTAGTIQTPIPQRRVVVGENGTLYVTTSSAIQAVNPETGAFLGSLPLDSETGPAMQTNAEPSLVDGTLFVAGATPLQTLRFAAVDASTMDTLWTADTGLRGGRASTPSVASNGIAYVHEANADVLSRLHAVDLDARRFVWSVDLEQTSTEPTPPVILEDGRVLVSAGAGVFAVTPTPNGPEVSIFLEAGAGGTLLRPALSNDGETAYVVEIAFANNVFVGTLYAIDVATGAVIWESGATEEDGSIQRTAPPVVGPNGNIYVGVDDADVDYVAALSPEGILNWFVPLPGTISQELAVRDDGTLLVGVAQLQTLQQGVVALSPDGTVLWATGLPAQQALLTQPPTINGAGTVYLPVEGGVRTIVGPQLSAPSSVDFGAVPVGQTRSQTVEVTNTGDAPVLITGVRLRDAIAYGIVEGGAVDSLAPGERLFAQIDFTPPTSGTFEDDLIVEASTGTLVTALSGTGEPGTLSIPDIVDFGSVPVGASSPVDTVFITNAGPGFLQIEDVSLRDGVEFEFVADSGETELIPNGSRRVVVRFTPSTAGERGDVLTVTSDAGTATTALTGVGVIGELSVPAAVAFDSVEVGSLAPLQEVAITNTGEADVTLTSVALSSGDDFTIETGLESITLAPGESLGLQLGFAPVAAGLRRDTLTVTSTVGAATTLLTGVGLAGVLSVPEQIVFEDAPVGTPAPDRTLAIANTGTAPFAVESVSLSATEDFAILNDTGEAVLEPGATRTVRVRFVPSVSGVREAAVTVATDLGTAVVGLVGTGVRGTISAPEEIAFGNAAVDTPAPERSLTITNTGSGPLAVESVTLRDGVDFSITGDTGPPVLLPDSARTIRLGFTPTALGAREDALTLVTDAGTAVVTLTGSGVLVDAEEFEGVVGQPATVSLDLPEDFAPQERTLCFRAGGTLPYTCLEMALGVDGVEGELPVEIMTERGAEFFVRLIESTDTGVTEVTFPSVTPETNPADVRVAFEALPAAGAFAPEAYRMVSVPGDLTDATVEAAMEDEYGPYTPTQWRVLRWNAATETYDEIPDLGTDLVPGAAVWLVTRRGDAFDAGAGRSTPLDPVSITLPPGWTQIGSPFAFAVAWDDVDGAAALPDPQRFDGEGYVPNQAVLAPWDGYFVENPTPEPVTITIPPREAGALSEEPVAEAAASVALRSADGYTLRVIAEWEGRRDAHTYLGVHPDARDGRDPLDFGDPPPIGDHVQVSVVENGARLAGSFRPASATGQTWTLDVSARRDGRPATGPVHLALQRPDAFPADHTLHVIDVDAQAALPLVAGRVTVSLTDARPTRRLQVIAGTPKFAADAAGSVPLTPRRFALHPVFPNPMRTTGTVVVDLPAPERVTAEVFDVLGRRVRTLHDTGRDAGTHVITWNGRGDGGRLVASGIYFVRVTAGPHRATQKLVVIR